MRRAVLLTLAAIGLAAPASAQDDTMGQPPADSAPAPTPPPAPLTPAPPPPTWVPRQAADLLALDKVAAQTTRLSLQVGQTAGFGSLTIALRACDTRPPDVPADSTAWLDITDSKPGAPEFHGWLIASAPGVSGLQHPTYDVRLAGCH